MSLVYIFIDMLEQTDIRRSPVTKYTKKSCGYFDLAFNWPSVLVHISTPL